MHSTQKQVSLQWGPRTLVRGLVAFTGLVAFGCSNGGGGAPLLDTVAPALDVREELPGGTTTSTTASSLAFSRLLANIEIGSADSFFIGNSLFKVNWVTAPASVINRDGLGPLFNARSCSACHNLDGRGRPPVTPTEEFVGLLLKMAGPTLDADGISVGDSTYGAQLQGRAVIGVDGEATERVTYTLIPGLYDDGEAYELRQPVYSLEGLQYGALDGGTVLAPRVAPAVFGLGLLGAVEDAVYLAMEDPSDLDGDGIRGRANLVRDLEAGGMAMGRYGWKAGQPNLKQQAAAAFRNDIGITNSIFPTESNTPNEAINDGPLSGGSPELLDPDLAHMDFYLKTLAVPKRRDFKNKDVLAGRELFYELNCTGCHQPSYQTASTGVLPALADQTIFPYTDLLLHDMGPDLADGRVEAQASESDWRTPPLWGLGLTEVVNGHSFFLHDGRARGVAEAILWHGGEATASRDAFKALSAKQRAQLIQFVEDL